jgi:hypothetical protein
MPVILAGALRFPQLLQKRAGYIHTSNYAPTASLKILSNPLFTDNFSISRRSKA